MRGGGVRLSQNRWEGQLHRTTVWLAAIVTAAAVAAGVIPVRADTTIIDDWYKAKLPTPPELKPVTLDAKTTALLVMDFTVLVVAGDIGGTHTRLAYFEAGGARPSPAVLEVFPSANHNRK